MQRIKVEQAAPGMVIAHPIETPSGQILCAKGTELTEGLVERLEKIEITHVFVDGHPVDDGKPIKSLDEELSALEQRFSAITDNKLMSALKMIVQKHLRDKHQRELEEETKDTSPQEEVEAGHAHGTIAAEAGETMREERP